MRRTVLIASLFFGALSVSLLTLMYFSDSEEGFSKSSNMTCTGVQVIQDSTPVLRGSIHQCVLGIVVETRGKGTPVLLNEMIFSAKGTTLPIEKNIENARLWYTGNDPGFSLQETVGNTVVKPGISSFAFSGRKELLQGKNYFWLTFDVRSNANSSNSCIDAICSEVLVNGLTFSPEKGQPSGHRLIQNNVPYYSMGNLSLNKLNSWNSKRDGSGLPPKQLNESRNSFFIQAGHRMISSTGGNLQTLVVEKGGELKITSPLRLSSVQVAYGGTLRIDSLIPENFGMNELILENGAIYVHNNEGSIPSAECIFKRNSTQLFYCASGQTFEKAVSFGNLIFNLPENAPFLLCRNLKNVRGNLEIRSSGRHGISIDNDSVVEIGGDLIISGGRFSGPADGALDLNVAGSFILHDGTFNDVNPESLHRSNCILRISKDVILMGGKLNTANSKSSVIYLNGKNQSRWIQRNNCNVRLGNVVVENGHAVFLKGELIGPVADHSGFIIAQGAELYCDKSVITGNGSFRLDEKAMLGIGHPDGINSNALKGNIQTAIRIFHSGAIYQYYSDSHPQSTGIFETSPKKSTVYQLLVNKNRAGQVLNLSQSLTVDDQCSINSGDLHDNGYALNYSFSELSGTR